MVKINKINKWLNKLILILNIIKNKMGCCVRRQDEVVIKSSSIPLSHQKPLENVEENNFRNNSNTIPNIVISKQKVKPDKSSNITIQKGKNKTGKKNIKSMNALKELSYNEVNESTKYF